MVTGNFVLIRTFIRGTGSMATWTTLYRSSTETGLIRQVAAPAARHALCSAGSLFSFKTITGTLCISLEFLHKIDACHVVQAIGGNNKGGLCSIGYFDCFRSCYR